MNKKTFFRISIISILAFITFIQLWGPALGEDEGHIQTLIDEAPSGSTVNLLEHTYDEEIIISKPITLIGTEHTIIRSCSNQPTIRILADDVQLKNIKIEHCPNTETNSSETTSLSGDNENHEHDNDETKSISQSAMFISGNGIQLENIQVNSRKVGIQLEGVTNSVINGGKITTNGGGNGIDVWESTGNVIQGVQIEEVIDGIYLERGNDTKISQNDIKSARYGIHLMYSDDVIIQSNTSHQNFTGAMVMTSKQVKITDNIFTANNNNVKSQGLLLFDAHQTTVINNTISENRVGIFMEFAQGNEVKGNHIVSNFIGVQFNNTNQNTISENTFIGNVNELQAVNSTENKVEKNYWDASIKLEKENKGISLFPYKAEPLYLLLTEDVPAYQLFFDSPSITVLKALFKVPRESVMEDPLPLMQPPSTYDGSTFNLLTTILKVVLGLTFIIIGIKLFNMRRKTQ